MNLNRGVARPSPAPAGATTRSNVTAPSADTAGVARVASSGLFGPLTRAAAKEDTPSSKKPGDKDQGLSDDDQEVAKVKKAKDETVAINSDKDKDKVEKAGSKDSFFDKDKKDTVDNPDDISPNPGQGQDDTKVKKAAGDGGDFKPMHGDDKNPWDANADKGENPAPNSTGAPDTPSGL